MNQSQTPSVNSAAQRRRLSPIWPILFLVALVVVPYLFWQGTWFGRPLDDQKMAEYLADTKKPRHIQHALSQIADRIIRGDRAVERWYPQVLAAGASPVPEVRLTAAWVMGQDHRSAEFHQALAKLVQDPEPMVRRNAALGLVRFGDARAKPVLVEMLRPYTITAPIAGTLTQRLKEGDSVDVGTLLARISPAAGGTEEVRSRLPGQVSRPLRADGAQVAQGEGNYELAPGPEQVWEALRALFVIGDSEQLADVDRFTRPYPRMPDKVLQQARLTSQAIQHRKH